MPQRWALLRYRPQRSFHNDASAASGIILHYFPRYVVEGIEESNVADFTGPTSGTIALKKAFRHAVSLVPNTLSLTGRLFVPLSA